METRFFKSRGSITVPPRYAERGLRQLQGLFLPFPGA